MKILHFPGAGFSDAIVKSLCGLGHAAASVDTWASYLPGHVDSVLAQKPDIVHLHWPESLCGFPQDHPRSPALIEEMRRAIRNLRGQCPVVYSMHNLQPHHGEDPDFWQAMYQMFAEEADGTVHHSVCGQRRAEERYRYPGAHAIIHHGLLIEGLDPSISQAEARRRLGWPGEKRIFWFFGGLRKNKNIDSLLDWAVQLDPEREMLYLCGRCSGEDLKARMSARVSALPTAELIDAFIPDGEAAWQGRAADALIVNHGAENLTSGSPHLSQALLIPQICLRCEYTEEILGEAGLYFEPAGDRVQAIQKALAEFDFSRQEKMVISLREQQPRFRWSHLAPQYLQFYRSLLR